MAACSRVGAGYGTAMLDAVLSITVFAAILLVIGAIFLWRRMGATRNALLMVPVSYTHLTLPTKA